MRWLITSAVVLAAWEAAVWLFDIKPFLLPPPTSVISTLVARADLLAGHAWITLVEILAGLAIGFVIGGLSALLLTAFAPARRWLLPLLVVSQALPVFALAPLLVLWFGYGMASKIAMAVLIIYFPVTVAFFDGLKRTEQGWLEMASVMGAPPMAILWQLRVPAALPALASGLRVAASVAPIGAIVGEWVGSSAGLGYLMLHANARMQIDLMFASLLILAVMALTLYFTLDAGLRRLTSWQQESHN